MKKIIRALAVIVCLSKVVAQNQVVTTDPVGYFRSAFDFQAGDRIFKLEVDLNNDGKQDILLSKTVHVEDGYDDVNYVPWEMFLLRADGNYASVGKKTDAGVNYGISATFPKDRYWVGNIPEISRHGLLYLLSGRGGQPKCQLHALVIEGEFFKDILIGEPVDVETGYEQLAQRIPSPPTPAVQQLDP